MDPSATVQELAKLRRSRRLLIEKIGELKAARGRANDKAEAAKFEHMSVRDHMVATLSHRGEMFRGRTDPVALARAEAFAAAVPAYREAVASWTGGVRPAGMRRAIVAGLSWSVPPDLADPGSLSHRLINEGVLPLDGIARVRGYVVGGVMLDIGANVGTTCLPRVVLGDVTRVYAAEPERANYLCLVGNVLDNGLAGHVFPDCIAITSRNGTAHLERTRHIGSHALVRSDVAAPRTNVEMVPCCTVDAWLDRLGVLPAEVRFVKTDTQGWDLQVLEGAVRLLGLRSTVWQTEVSPSQMASRTGDTVEAFCAFAMAHFTHAADLEIRGSVRPISELAAIIGAGRRKFVNILLYNN